MTDGAVGIQEPLAELIQSGATMEDQVVAVLHLSEKQAMLASGLVALLVGEERREGSQPLMGTSQQVSAGQGVGEFLQSLGIFTVQEGIGTLLKSDSFLPQAVGQPVMLIEVDPCREGEIGTKAHEHPSPAAVIDVKVVLLHPALSDLEMPAVFLFVSDRNHNTSGFAGLEDDHYLIRFGPPEVWFDEFVAPAARSLHDRSAPLLRPIRHPFLELVGDTAQDIPAYRVQLAVAAKETDHPLGLLKGLDQCVEQDAVKAPVAEPNAVLMMLKKGVHGTPPTVVNARKVTP
ncbi:MAG: hypothetical protein ACLQU2_29935 [Candidatus Binataceae bacterium]